MPESLMAWPDWPRPFLFYDRCLPLLTNDQRYRIPLSHETESSVIWRKSNLSCALPWHRRECKTWPFWTLSKTLSTKWTLQTLLIYSQLQKPGKDCFVLRTCNFGFPLIYFCIKNSFDVSSIRKKIFLSNFCDFAFSKVTYVYKAKVSSRTGGP